MTFPYGRMTFRLADKPLAKTAVGFKTYRFRHSGTSAEAQRRRANPESITPALRIMDSGSDASRRTRNDD